MCVFMCVFMCVGDVKGRIQSRGRVQGQLVLLSVSTEGSQPRSVRQVTAAPQLRVKCSSAWCVCVGVCPRLGPVCVSVCPRLGPVFVGVCPRLGHRVLEEPVNSAERRRAVTGAMFV